MFDKRAAVSCKGLSLVVELWCCWATTAFPCGHRCTVGIHRDPPVCLDAQGGFAKRQPFCGWCCVAVMCLGRDRRDVLSCTFCQMLELRKLTPLLEWKRCSQALSRHQSSVVPIRTIRTIQDSKSKFPCERLRSQSIQMFREEICSVVLSVLSTPR